MKYAEWQSQEAPESTAAVRARVMAARQRQAKRQSTTNARIDAASAKRHCVLDDKGRSLLGAAVDRFGWSARSATRIVRVARTIADLAGAEQIAAAHLAEALQLRTQEEN